MTLQFSSLIFCFLPYIYVLNIILLEWEILNIKIMLFHNRLIIVINLLLFFFLVTYRVNFVG
jgi:hypothetical protein